jgi:membrane protease YdiL (CAAX protease family)
VAWTDGDARGSAAWIARRCALGAGLGGAVALAGAAAAILTGAARLTPGDPSASALILGLVVAVLAAVRDELLLRGVPLRAVRGRLPPGAVLLVAAAAAVAAHVGGEDMRAIPVVRDALSAVALAALWTQDRGAWMAVAAHSAWSWVDGPLTRGGAVDLRYAADPGEDVASLVVVGIAAMAAAAWALRPPHDGAPATSISSGPDQTE